MSIRSIFLFVSGVIFSVLALPPLSLAQPIPPSTMTIYVYPSYKALDWNTPHGLLSSFIEMASIRAHRLNSDVTFVSDYGDAGTLSSTNISTMGHSVNHIECTLPNGSRYNKWVSFAGDEDGSVDRKNLMDDKIGMGQLFYEFVDGYIMAGPENVMRLVYNTGLQGSPRYLQFSVKRAECQRLKEMVGTFSQFYFKPGTSAAHLEERGPAKTLFFDTQDAYTSYQHFLKNRTSPLGGRCVSFSAGLIKMIGQYDWAFDSWIREIEISEKLIGQKNAQGKVTYEVSPFSILLGPLDEKWQYPDAENRSLRLYDPQLMWGFIGDLENCMGPTHECSNGAREFLNRRAATIGDDQNFKHTLPNCKSSEGSNERGPEAGASCEKSVQISGVEVH